MQKPKQGKRNSLESKNRRSGNGPVLDCQTLGKLPHQPPEEVYKLFQQNLFKDGCPTAAGYFGKLVAKEDDLIKTNIRLKKRVRDFQCLLLAIVENITAAEKAYQTTADQKLTLRLLIQTVHMIQAQDEALTWVVKEAYKIILHISREWEEECLEMLSRTRFEYGTVLAADDGFLEEAINYIEKSLETCKGTTWYTNEMDRIFLYQDVCTKLCETLLRSGAIKSKSNPKMSAILAERAAITVEGVGTRDGPRMYCFAKIRQSEYLAIDKSYQDALEVLNEIERDILSTDAPRNMCEWYLWLGICHFNIHSENKNFALKKFKLSLDLCEIHNFADLKAEALLYLGKIHSKDPATHDQARQCFIEAKELFRKLQKFENEKLAKFLMAQLKAYQIFPNYLELIERTPSGNFCYMFNLLQWKQKLLPFWNEDGTLKEHEDDIQCILKENLLGEDEGLKNND